jgi:hypothetical protein
MLFLDGKGNVDQIIENTFYSENKNYNKKCKNDTNELESEIKLQEQKKERNSKAMDFYFGKDEIKNRKQLFPDLYSFVFFQNILGNYFYLN